MTERDKDAGFQFTPRVMRRIQRMVRDRVRGPEIARRLGCPYGSLRVICSANKISLRPEPPAENTPSPPLVQRPLAPMGRSGTARAFAVPVGERVIGAYERRATLMGVSAEVLAARILELVASEDLFEAVIDR